MFCQKSTFDCFLFLHELSAFCREWHYLLFGAGTTLNIQYFISVLKSIKNSPLSTENMNQNAWERYLSFYCLSCCFGCSSSDPCTVLFSGVCQKLTSSSCCFHVCSSSNNNRSNSILISLKALGLARVRTDLLNGKKLSK